MLVEPGQGIPVMVMYRPCEYTSIPSFPRCPRPGPGVSRPKICRPSPDGLTSIKVAGAESTMRCAHGSSRPSTMQWSRSIHPIPSPSTKPKPSPRVDFEALAYDVHVDDFVEEAGAPVRRIGNFVGFDLPRDTYSQRTQRSRDVSSTGGRFARCAATRQRVEQNFGMGPRPASASAPPQRWQFPEVFMPPFYQAIVTSRCFYLAFCFSRCDGVPPQGRRKRGR